MMDKRILILGSILTIVILIGVSFSSVVGYSNNTSYSIESPLYNVRSNRAIENGEDLTICNFVGKGKGLTIPISEWDNSITLKQQILDKIKGMDRKSQNKLNKLVVSIINNLKVKPGINIEHILDIYNNENLSASSTYENSQCLLIRIIYAILTILGSIVAGIFTIFLFITVIIGCIGPTFWCPTDIQTMCHTACFDTNCETYCVTVCYHKVNPLS
jgi:hypothetical protein